MPKRFICDVDKNFNDETEQSRTKRMRLRNDRARVIHAGIDVIEDRRHKKSFKKYIYSDDSDWVERDYDMLDDDFIDDEFETAAARAYKATLDWQFSDESDESKRYYTEDKNGDGYLYKTGKKPSLPKNVNKTEYMRVVEEARVMEQDGNMCNQRNDNKNHYKAKMAWMNEIFEDDADYSNSDSDSDSDSDSEDDEIEKLREQIRQIKKNKKQKNQKQTKISIPTSLADIEKEVKMIEYPGYSL